MNVDAEELIRALTVVAGIDDDQEVLDYWIDNVAWAAALLTAALVELLKAAEDDERSLV